MTPIDFQPIFGTLAVILRAIEREKHNNNPLLVLCAAESLIYPFVVSIVLLSPWTTTGL